MHYNRAPLDILSVHLGERVQTPEHPRMGSAFPGKGRGCRLLGVKMAKGAGHQPLLPQLKDVGVALGPKR